MEKEVEIPETHEELDITDVEEDPVAAAHYHADDGRRVHGETIFSVLRSSDAS